MELPIMASDIELLEKASELQDKIMNSGAGLMSVETNNGEVLAAIERMFGVNTNVITFEMFTQAVRGLYRSGIIHGYENA